jgi:hypothetical protein
MTLQWKSKKLYSHPSKHQSHIYGSVILSKTGMYHLKAGVVWTACPQDWAAAIHKNELEEKTKMGRPSVGSELLPVLTVPEELKTGLESIAEKTGLSMPDIRREAYRAYITASSAGVLPDGS